MKIEEIMTSLEAKHHGEVEYLQAVKEVLMSVADVYQDHPEFERQRIIGRMDEPDRIHALRLTWIDDSGKVLSKIGYAVKFHMAVGP